MHFAQPNIWKELEACSGSRRKLTTCKGRCSMWCVAEVNNIQAKSLLHSGIYISNTLFPLKRSRQNKGAPIRKGSSSSRSQASHPFRYAARCGHSPLAAPICTGKKFFIRTALQTKLKYWIGRLHSITVLRAQVTVYPV